jgi:hypothetical protein
LRTLLQVIRIKGGAPWGRRRAPSPRKLGYETRVTDRPIETPRPAPLWKRLAWFGALSLTGALSCAAIAYAMDVLLG